MRGFDRQLTCLNNKNRELNINHFNRNTQVYDEKRCEHNVIQLFCVHRLKLTLRTHKQTSTKYKNT